jgi:hypothetical protein
MLEHLKCAGAWALRVGGNTRGVDLATKVLGLALA